MPSNHRHRSVPSDTTPPWTPCLLSSWWGVTWKSGTTSPWPRWFWAVCMWRAETRLPVAYGHRYKMYWFLQHAEYHLQTRYVPEQGSAVPVNLDSSRPLSAVSSARAPAPITQAGKETRHTGCSAPGNASASEWRQWYKVIITMDNSPNVSMNKNIYKSDFLFCEQPSVKG